MKIILLSICCLLLVVPAIAQPALSVTFTNPTCNGLCNGTIDLTVTGGTPPYSYLWVGPSPYTAVVQDPNGICSGTYDVTVTDGAAMTATTSVTINQPVALTATISSTTNTSCNGICDGTITIMASGGTPPYTYFWNTFPQQNTPAVIDLCVGMYSVTIVDANACSITTNAVVSELSPIIISISGQNTVCPGNSTSIIASVTGGITPYSYIWSNASTAQQIPNATAGTWCVTITDANGCTGSQCVTITESPAISLTVTTTPQSCHNSCDATATAIASGGVPPFSYLWSHAAITHIVTNLCSGHYEVTVVDSYGCAVSDTVVIANPSYAQIIGTLDNSNGPIAAGDAIVILYNSQWDSLGSFAYNGLFHFPNLCPDDYYLFAELTNTAPYPLTVNSYYDSTLYWQNADSIHLVAGDSTIVIFTLAETVIFAPGPGNISGNITYGSYTGSKSTGEPVEGAEIELENGQTQAILGQDVTNASGEYSFTGIPVGDQYTLLVEIPGIPLVFTWDNISITTTNTNFFNLDFIVDTVLNGIYTDSTMTTLDKDNSGSIEVYPNPFSENLTINIKDSQNSIFIGLFDVTGKCVYENALESENSVTIAFPELNPGMYYLKMTSGNTMFIKKLVKR